MYRRTALILTAVAAVATAVAVVAARATAAHTDSVTVSVLDYWGDEPANSTFNKLLAYCESHQPGLTFKRNTVPQADLITKAVQLAAAHTAPDLVVSDNPNIPELAQAGVLQPVDQLAAKSKIDLKQFYPGPLSSAKWNGHLYGVPIGNNGEAIVYNKAMFKAAGLKPPKSWADLLRVAKALKKGTRYGFAVSAQNNELATWNWEGQLWSNGGDLDNLTSAKSVQAMTFWASLVKKGLSPKAELNWGSGDVEQLFVKRGVAMGQMGSWEIPIIQKDAAAKHIAWGVIPQVGAHGIPVTPFGGEVMAVGAGADSAKVAAIWTCLTSVQKPQTLISFDAQFGYVPTWKPAAAVFLKKYPIYSAFAKQLATSRSRTAKVGAKYDAVSKAISTAIQDVMSGQESAAKALSQAQKAATS